MSKSTYVDAHINPMLSGLRIMPQVNLVFLSPMNKKHTCLRHQPLKDRGPLSQL